MLRIDIKIRCDNQQFFSRVQQVVQSIYYIKSVVWKPIYIYIVRTLLRHDYIARRRHGPNSNFLRATESCTRLHQAASDCTRLHQVPIFVDQSIISLTLFLGFNARSSGNILSSFLDVNSPQQIQEKSKHFCDLCQISFSKASNLTQHKQDSISHKSKQRSLNGEDQGTTTNPSHECSLCSKVYSSHRSLKRHIREAHEPDSSSSARIKRSRKLQAMQAVEGVDCANIISPGLAPEKSSGYSTSFNFLNSP